MANRISILGLCWSRVDQVCSLKGFIYVGICMLYVEVGSEVTVCIVRPLIVLLSRY